MDNEMYRRTIARYQSDLEKKKSELRNENRKGPHFKQISASKLNFISNPLKHYQSVDIEAKQNLLRIFFPENIKFSESKVRTPRLNEVVRCMLLIDKELKENESAKISQNLQLSRQVEPVGFEPTSKQG